MSVYYCIKSKGGCIVLQGLKARINKLFRSWAFIQIFIITLIITVGLILDLVIIFTGIEPIIRVDDGYLQSLFAMVFTVGTLSSSILAIIISALNSGNYGFTVKQYESFKCSPLKMKHILVVSAVLILISIAENSLLLYNSITLTGIALLAYYIFNSWIIFRMVSEREYAKELINKELKSEGIKTEYVYNWMNGLKSALAMKNTKEIETCTEFLKRTMESGNEDAKSLIQNEISEAFAVSNNNYSFMDSFSKVLRLNDSSELFDEYGKHLANKGQEFGATTGRPRRCGWFDATVVKFSAMVNGVKFLALTKLDVLDGLDEIKICIGYEYNGEKYTEFPSSRLILEKCKPIYITMPGWKESTKVKTYDEINDNAKNYLRKIEELTNAKIAMISMGRNREETIILNNDILEFNF